MEVKQFKDEDNTKGFMMRLDQTEALILASSLIQQVQEFDCNTHRLEFPDSDYVDARGRRNRCYFSVAVQPYPVRMPYAFKEAWKLFFEDFGIQDKQGPSVSWIVHKVFGELLKGHLPNAIKIKRSDDGKS